MDSVEGSDIVREESSLQSCLYGSSMMIPSPCLFIPEAERFVH